MSKYTNIIGIAIFFILSLFSLCFSEESITITTYYPSPYGSYNELRVNQMSIGSSYTSSSLSNGNLIVAGNVGIGTASPTLGPLQMGSGAYVTAGGVWTDASSRTYKQDIAPLSLDKALSALSGIKPVTFRYKRAPDEQHVGFISEDVPELVATKDRTGLSPMDIVAVLTKVVQQQQKEIEGLKQEIIRLKKK